jgi:D-glycero-D-manno-heptose 1,7-bisphosphate phosphatase
VSRALFLDRDGVINVEKNYVYRNEDFEFIDGIFELCARAAQLGFKLIVVTNQAGIGRGYYTVTDYEHLTQWMLDRFALKGIRFERVYYCPFHPTAGIGEFRRESPDRKPNPGMILRAMQDFSLDLAASVLVGDKDSDIEAGQAAGVGYNLKLIHGSRQPSDSARLEFTSLHAVGDWLEQTFG